MNAKKSLEFPYNLVDGLTGRAEPYATRADLAWGIANAIFMAAVGAEIDAPGAPECEDAEESLLQALAERSDFMREFVVRDDQGRELVPEADFERLSAAEPGRYAEDGGMADDVRAQVAGILAGGGLPADTSLIAAHVGKLARERLRPVVAAAVHELRDTHVRKPRISDDGLVRDKAGNVRPDHAHLVCNEPTDPERGHDHYCDMQEEACDDASCFGELPGGRYDIRDLLED